MSTDAEKASAMVQAMASALEKNKQLHRALDRANAELLEWENKEASVCPEDVGFVEYINSLTARLKAAEERVSRMLDAASELKRWALATAMHAGPILAMTRLADEYRQPAEAPKE